MTDEREKKERVFEMFAILEVNGEHWAPIRAFETELQARDWVRYPDLGDADSFRLLPCRVIVEDEP